MNLPWVYMSSQSWTPLPTPTPYHLSGSSPCTSPKHPVSCIGHRLAICFLHDSIHVSMPFSQIISPSHSFTSGWPVFPAPLANEIVFSSLYIFAYFVKDKVYVGEEIYLWAFHFVPLIYISVFVPVPYCPDDCGFVVEPKERQVDSSRSILFSPDCFGYSKFFVSPYKLWNYLF